MRVLVFLSLLLSGDLLAEVRTWTEATSGRSLEAEYLSSDGRSVTLRRAADGRRFSLQLDSLGEEDREYVAARSGGNAELARAEADLFDEFEWKSAGEIPVSGEARPRFEKVDAAITAFMAEKGVGAIVAAISEGGEVVYDRAFGYGAAKGKEPLPVGTRMRLASISKPLTAAVTKTLIREGKLGESDTAWEILELEGSAPADVDPRWKVVTVAQLLEHEGGWDRDASLDPLFAAPRISEERKVDLDELAFEEVLQWMLRRPLDFDPGEKRAYSNFGYTLLAHLCATASGASWEELLRNTIGTRAKMTSLAVGRTDLEKRGPGETWYHYHPEYREDPKIMPVRMEIKQGSGSIVCSAGDLCRFLESYWISGEPREGNGYNYTFFGSMPGTTSVCRQRGDGLSFAVITNRRDKAPSTWNEELKDAVEAALDGAE